MGSNSHRGHDKHHNFHFPFHLPSFLLHHHHHNHQLLPSDIPKGCLAIWVGADDEEQERFLVPVSHLSHPFIQELLREAEEKYGFEHKGAITLPCSVDEFKYVEFLIKHEASSSGADQAASGSRHQHHRSHLGWFRL